MTAQPVMELIKISKRFGSVIALRDVSLNVNAGECVGLVGDNGAGKSTLAKIMVGYYRPDSGRILFEGKEVELGSPSEARKLGIEMVYQDLALLDIMSIWRNLFLGKEWVKSFGPLKLLDKKAMRDACQDFLKDIGISIRSADELVRVLSGGERQSIAVAKAIYFGTKLLILDEPTTALSFKEAEKVLKVVKALKQKGLAVVFISHNIYHVYDVADRFVILDRGEKKHELPKEEVAPEHIINIIKSYG